MVMAPVILPSGLLAGGDMLPSTAPSCFLEDDLRVAQWL